MQTHIADSFRSTPEGEVSWLQPIPDDLLIAADDETVADMAAAGPIVPPFAKKSFTGVAFIRAMTASAASVPAMTTATESVPTPSRPAGRIEREEFTTFGVIADT